MYFGYVLQSKKDEQLHRVKKLLEDTIILIKLISTIMPAPEIVERL